jgi:hypothetical protein
MNAIDQAIRCAIGVAALAALGACTSLPVTTDINPNASVAVCHTYAFAQEHSAASAQPGGAYSNPLNSDRLRAVIAANLSSRGFQPAVEHGSADCVVGYAIGSRVVADEFAGFGVGWGWGGRRGFGFGGVGYDWPPVRNEGRIAIDLFDAHSRQAIWHASVNQNVTDLTGPNAELRINEAANAIFTKFPVPAGAAPPVTGGPVPKAT